MSSSVWNEEHHAFRDAFGKFLDTEAVPHHERWEKQGQVDREIWTKAGQNGFLCFTLDEAYGGSGVDFRYTLIEKLTERFPKCVVFFVPNTAAHGCYSLPI